MDRMTRTTRLKEHLEALHEAERLTDKEWVESWAKTLVSDYMPKDVFIGYLRHCVCKEVELMLDEAS